MALAEPAAFHRKIRSFVRREGRMTTAQTRALVELWPRYGLDVPAGVNAGHGPPYKLTEVFGRSAPVVLEIGFGNGDHLLARAQAEPEKNFLGIEVHRPGAGHVLMRAAEMDLCNVRVACVDAVEVLRDWLPPDCLHEVLIFFPDPWHKKRHHKRRLIQPGFAELLVTRLAPGGRLHVATDWAPYAEHMLGVLNAVPRLRNQADHARFIPRPVARAVTKFETRGKKLGHEVFDLLYARVESRGRESGAGGQG